MATEVKDHGELGIVVTYTGHEAECFRIVTKAADALGFKRNTRVGEATGDIDCANLQATGEHCFGKGMAHFMEQLEEHIDHDPEQCEYAPWAKALAAEGKAAFEARFGKNHYHGENNGLPN